jgi:hypothetical protein
MVSQLTPSHAATVGGVAQPEAAHGSRRGSNLFGRSDTANFLSVSSPTNAEFLCRWIGWGQPAAGSQRVDDCRQQLAADYALAAKPSRFRHGPRFENPLNLPGGDAE